MTKQITKSTLCFVFVFLFLVSIVQYAPLGKPVSLSAGAVTANELKKKQEDLQKQQKNLKDKLSKLKNDKDKAQEYLNELNELIKSTNEEISTINQQIKQMDAEIKVVEKKIAVKEDEIQKSYEKFKQRMRTIYMSGDITGGLELILCADSFEDMVSNSKYVEALAKYDQGIMDTLKNDKDGYLQDKQEIQNRKKEVQVKKTELSDKKAEVDALVKESKTQLAKIEAQQKALEAEQKKIDLEMDKARKQLDDIISQANNDKTTNDKITYDQSNFLWPTPGYYRITSPYGMRNGRLHKGVDIGAPTGAKIVSAKAGVVYTKAYDSGGYGNYVIVNHGGGYMTVYAHMSSVSVSKGQQLAKGQKIGEVGSTGRSTGPHLHFEIRKDGTAGNPMNYY